MTLHWAKAAAAHSAASYGTCRRSVTASRCFSAKVEVASPHSFSMPPLGAWRLDEDCDARDLNVEGHLPGELVNEVVYACVQFHGAMGVMREVHDRAHGA